MIGTNFRYARALAAYLAVFAFPAAEVLALTPKPNAAPTVAQPVANYTQYNSTVRAIDLSTVFRDPDASAAMRVTTVIGAMNFTLDGETAPITVANFLRYVDEGRYFKVDPTNGQLASTFFHRSVPNFVIQAGGFIGTVDPQNPDNALPTEVAPFAPIQNEPVISNTRATIAMAKVPERRDENGNVVAGTGVNSATSQWFINLADNSVNLDAQNGGFTVFGRVAGGGMSVADAIAALPRHNFGAPFDSLPLRNYTIGQPVRVPNLVSIPGIDRILPLTFTAESANTAVADVRVSAGNLLVNAKQPGTTQITVTATDLDGAAVTHSFNVEVVAAPGRLLNISTRLEVRGGEDVLIGGFIIRGGTSKRLLIRAIGPSLADSGVAEPLSNPTLELRDQNQELIAANDDWGTAPNRQAIVDTGIAPKSEKESAILVTVPSGADNISYTAIVRGTETKDAIGLVEVYDLDSGPGSNILNISTRGSVSVGERVMIGGFILGGSDARRVVVRAIGPSLSNAGITGTLTDPTLELRDGNGALLDANNDWQTHPQSGEIQAVGLAPSNARESAILRLLTPGAYTAVLSGEGDTPTGIALVEVYQLP